MSPRSSQAGFTLLETLVALVIAAAAAAVISAFLRGIMARVEKEQEHQIAVLRLMNQAALLHVAPLSEARWVYDKDVLRLVPARANLAEIEIRNFLSEERGMPLPPIELAFTPYQRLTLREDRYTLQFLRPSLPSPVRKSAAASSSTSEGETATAPTRPIDASNEASETVPPQAVTATGGTVLSQTPGASAAAHNDQAGAPQNLPQPESKPLGKEVGSQEAATTQRALGN